MALGVDEDGFLPGELHLHGDTGAIGQQSRVVLHGHILLASEAAAHELVLHEAQFGADAEKLHALPLGGVGALVGGEKLYAAVFQRKRHAAFRLQERVLRPGRLKALVQDISAACDGRVRVAAGDMLMSLDIAVRSLEDEGSAGSRRLRGIVHGGQGLVFHADELFGLLQRLPVPGAYKGHGVPEIMGDLTHGNEGRLILLDVADIVFAGHVLCRQHAYDPGQGLGLRGVDGQDPRPCVIGADGAAEAHALDIDVVGVDAIALDLLRHIDASDAAADLKASCAVGDLSALPEQTGGQQDAVQDLHIPRAAADVPADGCGGLFSRGVGVRVDECLGAQDHPGDAEAALHCAGLPERIGVHGLLPVGETLHGQDALSLQFIRLRHACLYGLSVHEHGAGAAGALAAAVLDACEMQLVPKEAQELQIFLSGDGPAVHGKRGHGSAPLS